MIQRLNAVIHARYEIFYNFNYRLLDLSDLCGCAWRRFGANAHTQGAPH